MILVGIYSIMAARTAQSNAEHKVGRIKKVQSQTEAVLKNMEELSETLKTGIEATYIDLEKLERASGVTKEAMQGVSVGANDTALAVQDQLLQTEEIQKKVDVVNDANEQIVDSMQQTLSVLKDGNQDMEVLVQKVEVSVKNGADVAEKLQTLDKYMEQMNTIVELIKSIASQTSLLALNASIEAARAGEAGRGFAVVADEIGKLAGNSADAAAKIRQVSAEVIQAVDELAEGSQQMIEFVRNSTEEGFGGLVATSENYATDANAMRAMMEQFAQTAEELRSTMDGIRESISAVNIAVEESAKGIAGVSESSVQLTGNVNDIQSEASDNNGIAEDLATEVGKFKLE